MRAGFHARLKKLEDRKGAGVDSRIVFYDPENPSLKIVPSNFEQHKRYMLIPSYRSMAAWEEAASKQQQKLLSEAHL